MTSFMMSSLFASVPMIAIEMILVRKFVLFDRINSHSWLAGFLLSVAIGRVVAIFGGLDGQTAGMGMLIAAVVTDTIWAGRRKARKDPNNDLVLRVRHTVNETRHAFRTFVRAVRILTMPIWVPIVLTMRILAWYDKRQEART